MGSARDETGTSTSRLRNRPSALRKTVCAMPPRGHSGPARARRRWDGATIAAAAPLVGHPGPELMEKSASHQIWASCQVLNFWWLAPFLCRFRNQWSPSLRDWHSNRDPGFA